MKTSIRRIVPLCIFATVNLYLALTVCCSLLNNWRNEPVSWTVLMTVNSAFFDFYLNWLWHYQHLRIPADIPVVVIAEDEQIYRTLTALNTTGVTVRKSHMKPINRSLLFDTPSFKEFMARRAVYILDYLDRGANVLHVDVDSVWLKNPFPYLLGHYDMWGQVETPNKEVICIGFLAFRSNDKNKAFVQLWINKMKEKTNIADQDVFKELLPLQKHIRVHRLPRDQFPSGKFYFELASNEARAKAVVVHNNWLIGHENKTYRFKLFNLWRV